MEKNGKNDFDESKEGVTKVEASQNKLPLKGGIQPLSLYTRRIIDISDITKFLSKNSSHGLCGSHNLGNTCFMNSSIACLSNCTELTYYFLSGEYKKDINRENKLGMGGALAESWADLLQDYWVGSSHVGNPSDLKSAFGKKIKRFSGYNQQDSNEFIDLFLDNLNEDLNHVTKKEYVELKEKGQKETDEQCSKRFWDNYLKRNDSIITDLFCGQMKSTVTCPECGFINITFDPFNTLNLNIPETRKKRRSYYNNDYLDELEIFYVPKFNLRKPVRVKSSDVPKKDKFKDWVRNIKNDINFKFHEKINKMILDVVSEHDSLTFINEQDDITFKKLIDENKFYFAFDIMNENDNICIPIYFRDSRGVSEFPRIVMVSEKDSTIDDLRKKIYFNLRKLILSPLKNDNEGIDDLSNKIIEYNNDTDIEDEPIFELINKEYNEIFKEKVNDEKINNFLKDIPFQIFLTKNIEYRDTDRIYIINNEYLHNLSKEFINNTEIKSYQDSITSLLTILSDKDYKIVVEFNLHSTFINKKLYKLNNCTRYDLIYNEIEEGENPDPDSGILTLKKCFKLFCTEEKLKKDDEWYCPQCKHHVLANKKMELYYTPKILIICFKRFVKHYTYWEKNEETIIFPTNNLDMKEFIVGPDKEHSVYDLFAVSQHYGGTGFGHYTAVCKNFNKWYSYNDSSVHETNQSDVVSSAAYVLFYRRRTD